MTIIEVPNSAQQNTRDAKSEEEMMPPTVSSPPPPSMDSGKKRVTFEAPAPTQNELAYCARVTEILPEIPQVRILQALRKIPSHRRKNFEDVVSELVDAMFNPPAIMETDKEHRPVQGPAERPTQTDSMPPLESLVETFPGPLAPHRMPSAASSSTDFNMTETGSNTEQTELQQAIQLSLQSSKPQQLPTISENPEDLKRTMSVGIHNVGQTCWFNVIAQVLFHIPKYRQLIYQHFPDRKIQQLTSEAKFLVELRKLFALLDAGNKRVVDPTPAMRALEEEFGSALLGNQHDASEMRDKVIGVIDRALRQASDADNRTPPDAELPNVSSSSAMDVSTMEVPTDEAMDETAIGDLLGAAPPKYPTREDVWTESPFRELFHYKRVKRRVESDSGSPVFESPTLTDMPTITCDVQMPSLHDAIEHHFTDDKTETYLDSLSEVIFISLNRFCYRNETGASKIHTELSIPQTIYMDRYMHSNYPKVKIIHQQREKIRHELAEYTARCNGFDKFPLGNGTADLLEIMNAAKMFVSQDNADHNRPDLILPSTNVDFSAQQLEELKTIFTAFCEDIASQKEQCHLQKDTQIESLGSLFELGPLKKEEYTLHSIIIHEGEADRGHYWTYVHCDPSSSEQNQWKKFNDSGVEVVSWEQVSAEAKGSIRPGVSAYALCYVKASSSNLLSDSNQPFEERQTGLPADLRKFVGSRNTEFSRDVEKYMESLIPPAPEPDPEVIFLPKANYTIFDKYEHINDVLDAPREPVFPVAIPLEAYHESTQLAQTHAKWCRQESVNEEGEWDQNLKLMNCMRIKQIIKRKYAAIYQDNINTMLTGLQRNDVFEVYNSLFKGIYDEFHCPSENDRKDVRCEPVTWWFSTGLGMSAFAFRMIIVKALKISAVGELKVIAEKEFYERITQIEQRHWEELSYFYKRFQSLYSLLKQLIGLTRITLKDCFELKQKKFEENTLNDYFEDWVKTLLCGHLALKVHGWLRMGLESYANQINRTIDVNEVTVPMNQLRITIIYPFLKLWRFVLYCIMQSRSNPTTLNIITDSHNFNLICSSLNGIAQYGKGENGDKLCKKIIVSIEAVLDMATSFVSANSPAHATIEHLKESLKPETTVVYECNVHKDHFVPNVEYEIKEMTRLRYELGFSDEIDSIETISRLLEEANSIFNTDWLQS